LTGTLMELLQQRRSSIVKRWTELVFDTYPADTGKFMRSVGNAISNPVGATIKDGVEKLFDWLVSGEKSEPESLCMFLDNIVRIRAVQEFSASTSIGFVFLVKTAVRELLHKEISRQRLFEELMDFDRRIDDLALLAFDNYCRCREQLHQIRAAEIRNRTSRLFEMVCKKYGMPSEWEHP